MNPTAIIAEITSQIERLHQTAPNEAALFISDMSNAGSDLRELLMIRESLDEIVGF